MKEHIRYYLFIFTGFLTGIFIFLPINEFTSYYEYGQHLDISVWQFILQQFIKAITFQTPLKLTFYMIFGGLMGAVSLITLINYRYRNYLIFQLHRELNKNIESILKKGENENTEFKSSFRYDYKQQKVNKALESVIVKTVAGFMNTMGGSLLIGVADDGSILGLEPDYNSLARKDSDGFTQLITSTISDKLGTPACRLLRIQFHQLNNKEICRIIVMPSPLPVYAREDKMTRFYVRTASGTREMDVDEAVAFIKMKWG